MPKSSKPDALDVILAHQGERVSLLSFEDRLDRCATCDERMTFRVAAEKRQTILSTFCGNFRCAGYLKMILEK